MTMPFALTGLTATPAFAGNRTRKKEEAAFRRLKIKVAQQANKEQRRLSLIRQFPHLSDDVTLKDALATREASRRQQAEERRARLPQFKAERKQRAIVARGLGLPRHASEQAIRDANIQMGYAFFSGLDPLARLKEIAKKLHLPASSPLARIGKRVEALTAAGIKELPAHDVGAKTLSNLEINARAAQRLGLPPTASRREILEARYEIPAL